jgi:hypothetical protein
VEHRVAREPIHIGEQVGVGHLQHRDLIDRRVIGHDRHVVGEERVDMEIRDDLGPVDRDRERVGRQRLAARIDRDGVPAASASVEAETDTAHAVRMVTRQYMMWTLPSS